MTNASGSFGVTSCQQGFSETCASSLKAEVSQLPANYVITVGPESTTIGTVAELNTMSQDDLANKIKQATTVLPKYESAATESSAPIVEPTPTPIAPAVSNVNTSNGQYFSDCAANPATSWAVGMMASCPMSNTYKYGWPGSLSNGGTIPQVYFQSIYDYRDNMPAKNYMTEVDPQPTLIIDGETINPNQYCPTGTTGIIAKDNWHDEYMIACK